MPKRGGKAARQRPDQESITLRIIAGSMRSRKLQFACDSRTRPMKDRTREAVMSLLGGTLEKMLAFDLFGGSGILAFESISRGALRGTIWEILRQGASDIRSLASQLGIESQVSVIHGDVFTWTRKLEENLAALNLPENAAWVVYCCPPYALWEGSGNELKQLMTRWYEAAPSGSLFAIELEVRTPDTWVPDVGDWDIRLYAPAKMAIAQKD